MPTKIKANGKAGNKIWKVIGFSGSGMKVGGILRGLRKKDKSCEAAEFLDYLEYLALQNVIKKRTPFTCAEPHAVALLLERGCTLSSIKLFSAVGEYGEIEACDNCSAWIYCGGIAIPLYEKNEHYTAKDYDQESNLSNVKLIKLNFNDKNAFPSLPNSNNNNNNISANKWKKFTKEFN